MVIEDVDRTRLVDPNTLRIIQVLTSQPDSCEFVIRKFGDRAYAPSVGDHVVIRNDGVFIFAGFITAMDEAYDVSDYIGYRVRCTDYTYKLDSKLVVEVFQNMTVNEIAAYLKANYLPSDISISGVDCDETVDYVAFNYETIAAVLTKLAELVGADWYIDYYKVIHFAMQNTVDAPFDLSDTGGKYIYDSLVIRRDQTQLRNIIYVRGGDYLGNVVTGVYDGNGAQRFFQTPYKLTDPALTVTGARKSVGVDPVDDPDMFDAMYNFEEKTLAFRRDKAPRDTSAFTGAHKVRISGKPNLPVIWKQTDMGSVDTFTAREHVIIDPSINSKEGARQRAYAELLAYKNTIAEAEFKTYEEDLHTGQKITIQSDLRGLNEDYIISRLEWSVFGMRSGDGCPQLVCKASLVTTRTFGFTQMLQRLLNQQKKSLVVTPGETLDAVESVEESISIAESVTTGAHNAQAESISMGEVFTAHADYGEMYVYGPWTGGYPYDTALSKKRLFIMNGSPLG